MQKNIYDNPDFFKKYKALRDEQAGLNEVLEQPAILSIMPDVNGYDVLDLGCGTGDLCRKIISFGAKSVIGVDISRNMLKLARRNIPEGIRFINQSIEDVTFDIDSFDFIISSLTFHYIANLDNLFLKTYNWLKPVGTLLFSMEHPIATSAQGIHPGWAKDESGNKLYWMLDSYSEEGKRESHWFVDSVVKYHRTLMTILNSLIHAGFTIHHVLEPIATPEEEQKRPSLQEERRRPPFLIVKTTKS